jgi:hypothetical protein
MPDPDLTAGATTGSDTTSSDTTSSDTTSSDTTSSDTTSGDTTSSDTTSGDTRKTRKGRRQGGPQPLTVFTGSHGLQADKPRAGEDVGQPDDSATADPDVTPDLRR